MTNPNDPDVPPTSTDAGRPTSRARRFGTPIVASLAVVGGLAVAPQVVPASAAPGTGQWTLESQVAAKLAPPPGYVWLEGALTDQAGHRLDNVNVEVWSNDPSATEPVASNLTYGGAPADGRHQHGGYRVQVPHRPAVPGRLLRRRWPGRRRRVPHAVVRAGTADHGPDCGPRVGCLAADGPQSGDDRTGPPGEGEVDGQRDSAPAKGHEGKEGHAARSCHQPVRRSRSPARSSRRCTAGRSPTG